jgi:adenylosuccinate synthase
VEEYIRQALDTLNLMDEDAHYDWRELVADVLACGERLQPMLTDVSVLLAGAMKAGQSVLFEGAQGTMLDVDHGTYPYVTSSSSTVGGACTGLGVGPGAIGAVIGIAKAYTTRVGEGPFPSELHDAFGAALREKGQEFGAVTGRPRRCGWFDAVVVRHAVRVNGLDGLALTKLDVLDGLDTVEICVGYRIDDETVTEFPADLRRVQRAVPVLESMPGWKAPTAGCRDFAALPEEARAYVARLEALTGVPVLLVSTGAAREDTLIRDDPRATACFGTPPATSRS